MKECRDFTLTSYRLKLQILVLILLVPAIQAYGQANIALVATPTTSYVSPWETIDAVNDGFTPAHSNDKS
ncbi:MAG: hypothetical protein JSV22_09900, partial [Bacteroidales bacterium]